MTPSEQSDTRAMIERLKVADDTLRVTSALRTALRALAWYGKESNWREDDWGCRAVIAPPDYGEGGKKARNAIKRIERQLNHDATPSPLADLDTRS